MSGDAEYGNERDDESRDDQGECQGDLEGDFFVLCLGVGDAGVCEGEGAVDGGLVGPDVADCCDYSVFISLVSFVWHGILAYMMTIQSSIYDSTRRSRVRLRMMVIFVMVKIVAAR